MKNLFSFVRKGEDLDSLIYVREDWFLNFNIAIFFFSFDKFEIFLYFMCCFLFSKLIFFLFSKLIFCSLATIVIDRQRAMWERDSYNFVPLSHLLTCAFSFLKELGHFFSLEGLFHCIRGICNPAHSSNIVQAS